MKKLLKSLANLKLAIFLLLVIAFTSGLGSIIEQDKSIEFYQETYFKKIPILNIPFSRIILNLGFDHIYQTTWFVILLILFASCLITCTFTQQFPTLKFARKYYFFRKKNQFKKLEFSFKREKMKSGKLLYFLTNFQYSTFQQYKTLYAYKGLVGRIGPVIVHMSIILVLIGSLIGAFKGFNGQEFVPKSETFHIQNIIKTGELSTIPQNNFRINDFWLTYNKNNSIKQFQSDISILNGVGKETTHQTIVVNEPLIFNGVTVYQTDWDLLGLRLSVNDGPIMQLPLSSTKTINNQKVWVSWIPKLLPFDKKEGYLLLIDNMRGQVNLYSDSGKFLTTTNLGEYDIEGRVSIVDFISGTGIQIKSDPGLITIYTGFGFLLISSLISYISFSEFWSLEKQKEILYGGQTNRAKINFQVELTKIDNIFN